MSEQPLLELESLVLHFKTTKGRVQAVDKVNFSLRHNEAVVVVGDRQSVEEPLRALKLGALELRTVEDVMGPAPAIE